MRILVKISYEHRTYETVGAYHIIPLLKNEFER